MIQNPSLEPCSFSCLMDLRSGFHRAALPFKLRGIGGPGAPHSFEFVRRVDSGLRLAYWFCFPFAYCFFVIIVLRADHWNCQVCRQSKYQTNSGTPLSTQMMWFWGLGHVTNSEHPQISAKVSIHFVLGGASSGWVHRRTAWWLCFILVKLDWIFCPLACRKAGGCQRLAVWFLNREKIQNFFWTWIGV